MKIDTFKRIGKHHLNNCEDSNGAFQIGQDRYLISVSGGCSMGDESHFASSLFMKLLREICKEDFHLEFRRNDQITLEDLMKELFSKFFNRLKQIKTVGSLGKYDLLATLIIGLVDVKDNKFVAVVIGDGLIVVDGKIHEFDQDNQPDYIGYHVDKNFLDWYSSQDQIFSGGIEFSMSVVTDGIFTFSNEIDEQVTVSKEQSIMKYLLIKQNPSEVNECQNKMDSLLKNESLSTNDDLAITRIIL
ncbi:protein phosphatase 2C domain-containing protein [Neolewinella antarctica]|uniref:PPM-type phosphatase domain-containing protein n=1 Tax=Neolewinella antarctica TaxID=442734 RepID=A0ABX0XHP6_9BACT|nr:protein phosphatase 2C domain-containing protein [Neolewinella antarctica]NJC28278.1 hypothetical protein [Neolewinella antarctica]